jgi:hypothetical protein
VARNRPIEELIGWGANTVIAAFDRFLAEVKGQGTCVLDRLPFNTGFQYLRDTFQLGLGSKKAGLTPLKRVNLIATACEGASHGLSAADIVLGAFRYCVNERQKDKAPREMLPVIADMMWHRKSGNTVFLGERGLIFRPREVRKAEYKADYDDLRSWLQALIGNA